MAQPYVGEIRMFAGNFPPVGWMFCEGQVLPISEYETLFNLIGTTYGGDGQDFFALPDLRGRLPIHMGGGFALAQQGGLEEVILGPSKMPTHSHPLLASTSGATQSTPTGNVLGESASINTFIEDATGTTMAPEAISSFGGNQPHNNFQPYLCVDFIISLFGIFPSPN